MLLTAGPLEESKHDHAISIEKTMIPVATIFEGIFVTFFELLILWGSVLTDEAVFACPSGTSIPFRLERKTVPCKVALDVATTVEGILVTFFELLVS